MKLKLPLLLRKLLFASVCFTSLAGFSVSLAADVFDGYQKKEVTKGGDLAAPYTDKTGMYGFLLSGDLTLSPVDCPW